MTMMEKLRADQLAARKAHDVNRREVLTSLLAESAAVGKNKGNRETTDEEVLQTIRKFLKTAEDNKLLYPPGEALEKVLREITILGAYLPQQMSADDIRAVVVKLLETDPTVQIGPVMKHLRTNHLGQYDGKLAQTVITEVLRKNS